MSGSQTHICTLAYPSPKPIWVAVPVPCPSEQLPNKEVEEGEGRAGKVYRDYEKE
jgi:hypothetical protein